MTPLSPTLRHYVALGGSVLERTGNPDAPWRPLSQVAAETLLTAFLAAGHDAIDAADAARATYYTAVAADLNQALNAAGRSRRASQPITERRAA